MLYVFVLHFYLFRVGNTEGELIAVDAQLHGVAHRGILDEGDFGTGYYAHVEDVLP